MSNLVNVIVCASKNSQLTIVRKYRNTIDKKPFKTMKFNRKRPHTGKAGKLMEDALTVLDKVIISAAIAPRPSP